MDVFRTFTDKYLSNLHIPVMKAMDVVEILIIAFVVYHIIIWARSTKVWSLAKGIGVILAFVVIAAMAGMNTILWIFRNVTQIAIIAIIIILQPELRKALEELGRTRVFKKFLNFEFLEATEEKFSDKTITEIVNATLSMARVKTGALIVVCQNDNLSDFENTGITLDAVVTSQLLVNIFEKNTPLHDGAVIIEGDRVVSATCYLPLSDNRLLGKELGTRHRAGVGMSENNDSLTIIVSEETGKISVAYEGRLDRDINGPTLELKLQSIQNKPKEDKKSPLHIRLTKNGKKNIQ